AFLQMGAAELELLAAVRADSPVGKFVAKHGPGLHHVAFSVPDIEKALADARSAGMELIDAKPRMGMHGVRIAFVHPKRAGAVPPEFVEARPNFRTTAGCHSNRCSPRGTTRPPSHCLAS